MRCIASSILALAGAVVIGASIVANPRDPMHDPTILLGFLAGGVGLTGWLISFRDPK